MKKLLSVLTLSALAAASTASVVDQRYNGTCGVCHSSGVAGAPLSHDEAAWAPRLEKGMDALVKSTREGMGAMPAGGLCNDCSDEDYQALIEFMSQPK